MPIASEHVRQKKQSLVTHVSNECAMPGSQAKAHASSPRHPTHSKKDVTNMGPSIKFVASAIVVSVALDFCFGGRQPQSLTVDVV